MQTDVIPYESYQDVTSYSVEQQGDVHIARMEAVLEHLTSVADATIIVEDETVTVVLKLLAGHERSAAEEASERRLVAEAWRSELGQNIQVLLRVN